MLQVFYANIAKVDVAMLHVFYLHVTSSMRDLNVLCNMKQMLRRIFFLVINRCLTIFFNVANNGFIDIFFSMLRTLLFDVALDRRSI